MRASPERNFRLFWLGYTLSMFGDFLVPAALALAVVRATGSAGALALVLGCAAVPRLLLLPLGGVLADRWQPRRVALVADWVRAAVQLAVGLELVGGVFRLTDLAVAGVISGAASAFALPTRSALIAATVPATGRARANGLLGISTSAARVLGPGAAGALILTIGPGWAFVLDAATFVVSALALLAVRIAALPAAARRPVHRDLVAGWSELRRHDWLWTSLIGHAAWNLASAVLLTLGPLIAVRQLGGEAVWVATLQAGALGLLAGSLLAVRTGGTGRFRLRIARPVLAANLALSLYALPLALLAAAAPAPALLVGYALALAGLGFLNPVWDTAVQQHIPADRLSRVSSYDMLLSFGAMPLGYAVAAPTAAAFGNAVPLLLAAVLVLVCTAGTAAVPGVRRLGAAPAPAPATGEPGSAAATAGPEPAETAAAR
ncbi:MFS transporter [Micromonospora sp. NPDC049559]|uniref:MFS transporter n=1 Tax=Micromonospora sp. NPDC049559 TaxID=3155923 RepID=UPI0034331217